MSLYDSRVRTYLGYNDVGTSTPNTEEESILVDHWNAKYLVAKQEYEASRVNSQKVNMWRNAYMGNFNRLNDKGEEEGEKIKALRKMCFELVEEKIAPHIPGPKMTPRYHRDIVPVNATEALIMHEMDKMLSEEVHDESERSTLIDSTCWLKVSWDPFDNTHERSGMPKVECCPIDTVFPQPGIYNYKELEYIFERKKYTLAQIEDLFPDKDVAPIEGHDLVSVVECYYLNKDRHVGKFVWVENTLQVLCDDVEWAMRRRRECMDCGKVLNTQYVCPVCGSFNIRYTSVKSQKLKTDLHRVVNPYRSGQTADTEKDQDVIDEEDVIKAGTEIPFYLIRQLPFVPKRHIRIPRSMYGMSEVQIHLEPQDFMNKMLLKAEDKVENAKTIVSKLKDTRIDTDTDKNIIYVETESHQEAAAIQIKDIQPNIQEELIMAQTMYETSKSTAGITDTDQGKYDASARSGKAKQLQMQASQDRHEPSLIQRYHAYAGVYELIFKYLLAFCDEERSFINLMPDGSTKEEVWSKYMFLDKDDNGEFYYRDDFAWSIDIAGTIKNDRAAMWQMIDNDFVNGTLGNELDPVKSLHMYWHMKDQTGYPTAKFALAFLNDMKRELPTQIEQALVNNPDAVELALSYIADKENMQGGGGAGGARDGAGKPNNNVTHDAQQKGANNAARAAAATNSKDATLPGGIY